MTNENDAYATKEQPMRRRIAMRLRGRSHDGLRYRLYHALYDMHGWWDWGHALMALFGRLWCGNFSPPEPGSWYYTYAGWETKRGRRRERLLVAKSYDEYLRIDGQMQVELEGWRESFRALPEDEQHALLRDPERSKQRPPEPYWHVLNVQDDGFVLIPGNVFAERGGTNFGLSRQVSRLLVRYVVVEWWLKANWLGIRPWIYYKALHRAVDMRVPFRCQVRPMKNSGAYSHWACQERRRHDGPHGVNNYTWVADSEARYEPVR